MPQEKYIQFMEAVAKMRRNQKEYQRCKSSANHLVMKKSEKAVDELILQEIGRTEKIENILFS